MRTLCFSVMASAWLSMGCYGVVDGEIGPGLGTGGTSPSAGSVPFIRPRPSTGAGGTAAGGSGNQPSSSGRASMSNGGQASLPGTNGSGGGTDPGASASFCAVQQLLQNRCQSCHSAPPVAGAPMPLMTHGDLMAPARSDPTQRVADVSLARLQNTALPMPPRPAAPPSDNEIGILRDWIAAGTPSTCVPAGAGGASGAGGSTPGSSGALGVSGAASNPYATPVVCSSGTRWTGGDDGSPSMHPGRACISCHASEDGPRFLLAGTAYPTAHEPNDCNGVNGTNNGAQIVIVDATGRSLTLDINAAGNFMYEADSGSVALPFRAKIVRNGVERIMATPQQVGDCNSCHTQDGANGAPGRIMLP